MCYYKIRMCLTWKYKVSIWISAYIWGSFVHYVPIVLVFQISFYNIFCSPLWEQFLLAHFGRSWTSPNRPLTSKKWSTTHPTILTKRPPKTIQRSLKHRPRHLTPTDVRGGQRPKSTQSGASGPISIWDHFGTPSLNYQSGLWKYALNIICYMYFACVFFVHWSRLIDLICFQQKYELNANMNQTKSRTKQTKLNQSRANSNTNAPSHQRTKTPGRSGGVHGALK